MIMELVKSFQNHLFDLGVMPRSESERVVGGYWVHFTGFIPAQDSTQLVGYWFAWPRVDTAEAEARLKERPETIPYLVVGVRARSVGYYEPGTGFFDTRPEIGRPPIQRSDFLTEEGRTAILRDLLNARAQLDELIHRVMSGQVVPRAAGAGGDR